MPIRRVLWIVLGLTATGCGIAGIVLPLVPTTPFMLLAAFAFARSSPRLHNWLISHPRFGPPIHAWRAHGAISRKTKIAAIAFMIGSLLLSVAVGVSGTVIAVQAIVLAGAGAFIATRPEMGADPD